MGKKLTAEHRRRISVALTGKTISAETRLKLSRALKGRHLSAETRRKMSLARTGLRKSDAARAALSATRLRIGFPGPKGADSPTWKGGRIMKDGYVLVKDPDHPNTRKSGYVLEHVKVASEMIGRAILPSETVHHKNEIRSDNRPENLEVMTRIAHVSHHHKGRHKVASERNLRPMTSEWGKRIWEARRRR